MYIETPSAVKRDMFKYRDKTKTNKSKGCSLILSCEPPVPWTKTVDFYNLQKELTAFLQSQCWGVNVRGDITQAMVVIKKMREASNSRKRDDKALFKDLKEADKPED